MKLKEKITILVCSSDGYSDLWYPFFYLLNKFLDDKSIQIILNTESKNYEFEGLNIKNSPAFSVNETYGERMLRFVSQIETPYTLLLMDDFFVRDKIDINGIKEIISVMDLENDISYFNFDTNLESEQGITHHKLYNYSPMPKIAKYKFNMQAAIWKTEDFFNSWSKFDTPWLWEIYANYLTFDSDRKFFKLNDINQTPINYGYNPQGMGVFRGKWVKNDVVPLFLDHGIEIDFENRGFYDSNSKVNILGSKNKVVSYLVKRLGFARTFSIFSFKFKKKIGLLRNYENHIDYLKKRRSK